MSRARMERRLLVTHIERVTVRCEGCGATGIAENISYGIAPDLAELLPMFVVEHNPFCPAAP